MKEDGCDVQLIGTDTDSGIYAITKVVNRYEEKACIFPVFARCYQVRAIHVLWNPDRGINEIWRKREELQDILTEDQIIVAFFTCIALLDVAKKQGKRNSVDNIETDPFVSEPSDNDADDEEEDNTRVARINKPVFSFWIVFNSPEVGLTFFENDVMKTFFASGLDLTNCRLHNILPFEVLQHRIDKYNL